MTGGMHGCLGPSVIRHVYADGGILSGADETQNAGPDSITVPCAGTGWPVSTQEARTSQAMPWLCRRARTGPPAGVLAGTSRHR
jgi:hypothetical protein